MPNAGRGVFANIPVKKGEIIEICPVIALAQHDSPNVTDSFLINYFYFFGKKKERIVLVLGYGSLYNHSYTPNAKYKEQYGDKSVVFIALRDIEKDEEIIVNYVQGNKHQKYPLWFDAH